MKLIRQARDRAETRGMSRVGVGAPVRTPEEIRVRC